MSFGVSMLKPAASNPATTPKLTDELTQSVTTKRAQVLALLQAASAEFKAITFANSYGAEDMVLTDIIAKEKLAIEIFSLDTGRLPAETYTLMGEVESTYNTKPIVFFPKHEAVEDYVRTKGIVLEAPEVPLRATEPAAPPPSRSNTGTWLLTIVLLILIAGGAYAYFFHREEIETLIAGTPPPAAPPATTATAAATPPPVPEPAPVPAKPPAPEPPKKSSRLAIADYLATKPTPEALLARGKEYAQGGDLREAFLVWRAAAEAGNPQAEIEVASFYDPLMQAKAGFTPDGARAADWYERAALAGNAEAQRTYGLLLAKGGAGLPADPAKAKDWLKQAAAQNDAEAKKALDAMPK